MKNTQLTLELIAIMDDLKATNELIKLVPTATKELRNESPEQGYETSMRLINNLLEGNQASFNKLTDIIHSLNE